MFRGDLTNPTLTSLSLGQLCLTQHDCKRSSRLHTCLLCGINSFSAAITTAWCLPARCRGQQDKTLPELPQVGNLPHLPSVNVKSFAGSAVQPVLEALPNVAPTPSVKELEYAAAHDAVLEATATSEVRRHMRAHHRFSCCAFSARCCPSRRGHVFAHTAESRSPALPSACLSCMLRLKS